MNLKCVALKGCNFVGNSPSDIRRHYQEQHPDYVSPYMRRKHATAVTSNGNYTGTALEKAYAAKKAMRDSIKELEQERDVFQQKVLEYDNLIADLKKHV